jgi:hypothetical protein
MCYTVVLLTQTALAMIKYWPDPKTHSRALLLLTNFTELIKYSPLTIEGRLKANDLIIVLHPAEQITVVRLQKI